MRVKWVYATNSRFWNVISEANSSMAKNVLTFWRTKRLPRSREVVGVRVWRAFFYPFWSGGYFQFSSLSGYRYDARFRQTFLDRALMTHDLLSKPEMVPGPFLPDKNIHAKKNWFPRWASVSHDRATPEAKVDMNDSAKNNKKLFLSYSFLGHNGKCFFPKACMK